MENETDKARMAEAEGQSAEKKKESRKLTVEEEIKIVRMIEKEQDEEENLIEVIIVEEIILRRFHKYLKMFEKKELERIPTRKIWNYAINLRDDFVPKKSKIYLLSRIERRRYKSL